MRSVANPGRIAGVWYLLLILIGPLRLIYIPETLFSHTASQTLGNIASHEWLFRAGMVSELICAVLLILLTMAFYRLFRDVDQRLALMVVILGGVMPSLILFANVALDAAALDLILGNGSLAAFAAPERQLPAIQMLRLHDANNTAAEVLWGVWLFPLAMLIYRSRMLPRFLAVWLAIEGVAYIGLSFTGVLAPQYQHTVFLYAQPAFFAEIGLMLWLLIRGARPAEVGR